MPDSPSVRSADHRFRNQLNRFMLEAMLLESDTSTDEARLRQLERIETLTLLLHQFESDLKLEIDPDWLESKIRVLVVEDDASQRSAMVLALRNAGFYVAQATNGSEAIAYLLQAMQPDVVLMDISMPDCDGDEANRVINHVPMNGSVKVMAVTARRADEFEIAAFDDYLQKPIQPARLIEKVRELAQDTECSEGLVANAQCQSV